MTLRRQVAPLLTPETLRKEADKVSPADANAPPLPNAVSYWQGYAHALRDIASRLEADRCTAVLIPDDQQGNPPEFAIEHPCTMPNGHPGDHRFGK